MQLLFIDLCIRSHENLPIFSNEMLDRHFTVGSSLFPYLYLVTSSPKHILFPGLASPKPNRLLDFTNSITIQFVFLSQVFNVLINKVLSSCFLHKKTIRACCYGVISLFPLFSLLIKDGILLDLYSLLRITDVFSYLERL